MCHPGVSSRVTTCRAAGCLLVLLVLTTCARKHGWSTKQYWAKVPLMTVYLHSAVIEQVTGTSHTVCGDYLSTFCTPALHLQKKNS